MLKKMFILFSLILAFTTNVSAGTNKNIDEKIKEFRKDYSLWLKYGVGSTYDRPEDKTENKFAVLLASENRHVSDVLRHIDDYIEDRLIQYRSAYFNYSRLQSPPSDDGRAYYEQKKERLSKTKAELLKFKKMLINEIY